MSNRTKTTPKYQTKFESLKTSQLANKSIAKSTNSYLIEMNHANYRPETKENFKQQDMLNMLKKEPQIQVYENKISEQDEQIKYLQEENRELKSLINYMKLNNECQYCKNTTNNQSKQDLIENENFVLKQSSIDLKIRPISIICECETTNEEKLNRNYDLFLDNLLQQLISAIKIKDLIKLELFNNNTDINSIKTRNDYLICKSCKKIKLIENKTALQDIQIDDITTTTTTTNKIETNHAIYKFQDLLIKQKEQQLNILNELSKMLKGCKKSELIKDNTNVENRLKNSSSLISLESSSFSKFNFSKVFHSLSSIEIKQNYSKLLSNTSSSSSTTTTTSSSNNNSNLHSSENKLISSLNSYFESNNEHIVNYMSSKSSFTVDSINTKISSETSYCIEPRYRPSKIPKLNTGFIFQTKNTTNFNQLTQNSKIPIRIRPKPVQLVIKKTTKINETKKIIKKIVIKPKNIKIQKIVTKRPVVQQKETKNSSKNIKQMTRTATFDKIVPPKTETKIEEPEPITQEVPTTMSPAIESDFIKKQKRFCFPTHKSLSLYYNDRLNKRFNFKASKTDCINGFLPIKYLSETDVASLADRLSTYDKDLFYNVYHLDTLYNNIDYILFNSYASDTELGYSKCSKNVSNTNGPNNNQNCSNSSYKLFINDYFNHKYEEFDDDEEESASDISINQPQVHLQQSENKLENIELSTNDFNFELNKENIFKSYEINNSCEDDDDDIEYNNYDEDENDYIDRFDDCIDNYYLNDDLLFDDDILKISILNDLSNSVDLKQIKIELNHRSNTFDKKLFLDYVNSPTYSLSSFTSHSESNYSIPKSVADSNLSLSSPVVYSKKSNIVNMPSMNRTYDQCQSDSLDSQEFSFIFRRRAVSMPNLTSRDRVFSLKKSYTIMPLFKPFYIENNNKTDIGNCTTSALCSKTYNIIPINTKQYNLEDNKLNDFNTDFYKLCSESYLNGSDFNFNSSASISSFNYQKKFTNENKNFDCIQNSFTFPIKRIQCFNNE